MISLFQNIRQISTFLLFASLIGLTACGGGGGGGGDNSDQLRRTTDTGLRIVHGALDGSPITVRIGEKLIQTAGFVEPTRFSKVDLGSSLVSVELANTIGTPIASIPTEFERDTEYTLIIFGQTLRGGLSAALFPEPLVQPEIGFARVQLLNSYQGRGTVRLAVGSARTSETSIGRSSGFIEVASGPQTLILTRSSGVQLARLDLDLIDQGEVTILAAGSEDLGVVFTPVYLDLD